VSEKLEFDAPGRVVIHVEIGETVAALRAHLGVAP
jgi:hypothetical protein